MAGDEYGKDMISVQATACTENQWSPYPPRMRVDSKHRNVGGVKGLVLSRQSFIQDQLVQGQIGNRFLQPAVLALKFF